MQPTVTAPSLRNDLSEGMNRANNLAYTFFSNSYLLNRKPDYMVYLFTISDQGFKVSRPPILREMAIPGRTEVLKKQKETNPELNLQQEWALVASFPQPLLQPTVSVDSDEIDFRASDTRRFVMDIVNPANTGLDQDTIIDPKTNFSHGQNLGEKGLFWSFNAIPTEQEVKAARRRMETYFQRILSDARAVELSAPATLKEVLTPDHHFAADYFGEQYGWHNKRNKPGVCPICGDNMREGAPFHKTEDGGICVNDWERTVKAGARTRAQAYDATGDERFAPRVQAPTDHPKEVVPSTK